MVSRSLVRVGVAVCALLLLAVLVAGIVMRVALPDIEELDPASVAAYRAISGGGAAVPPVRLGVFDVYRSEKGVAWVKEACTNADLESPMKVTIYSMETDDEPQELPAVGLRVGGACLWQAALRHAAIAQVRFHDIGRVNFEAYERELRNLDVLEPTAQSIFDLYWQGPRRDGGRQTLTYVKAPCSKADVEAPFFLHVAPVSVESLSAERQQHGFASLDFQWKLVLAAFLDDRCVVTRVLPNYAIANIATGQYQHGGSQMWRTSFAPPAHADNGGGDHPP